MKKLSVAAMITLVAVSLLAGIAFAATSSVSGSKLFTQQVTLLSAATGTTAAYNPAAFTFDAVMNNLSCDLSSGASSTTTSITFTVQANQGSSLTVFPAASVYGINTVTLTGSTTATVMSEGNMAAKPFRTIYATVTAPTTTQVITINCSASQ